SAPPPWDLPPSAFDLQTYRFQASSALEKVTERQPVADWFYQRQWQRVRRLSSRPLAQPRELLVVCNHEALDETLRSCLKNVYRRVVEVTAGNGFQRLATDRFVLDPLDTLALTRLLDIL
ncbi:KR prefix domain-containing protein, partial [Pseudomonas viridiflava]